MNTKYVIGVDEVGYGSAAGNLTVVGVRATADWSWEGLADSKKLTPKKRAQLCDELYDLFIHGLINFSIVESSPQEIDANGLGHEHKRCIAQVIKNLFRGYDQVIVDGNLKPEVFHKFGVPPECQIQAEIKGDSKYPTIMAASIIAKEHRDMEMRDECHPLYPMYGWDSNVGYLAPQHLAGLRTHGFSPLHRKSYKIKL